MGCSTVRWNRSTTWTNRQTEMADSYARPRLVARSGPLSGPGMAAHRLAVLGAVAVAGGVHRFGPVVVDGDHLTVDDVRRGVPPACSRWSPARSRVHEATVTRIAPTRRGWSGHRTRTGCRDRRRVRERVNPSPSEQRSPHARRPYPRMELSARCRLTSRARARAG